MKRNIFIVLILVCIGCVWIAFASYRRAANKYIPNYYTKDEVLSLFNENYELFEKVVELVCKNDDLYEKGRINEYTDVDITSPRDDAMQYFNDIDRETIEEFFSLKPYMILYDYARRFVQFTFYGSDGNDAYAFVFWTSDRHEIKDYVAYRRQDSEVEYITDNCIMICSKA